MREGAIEDKRLASCNTTCFSKAEPFALAGNLLYGDANDKDGTTNPTKVMHAVCDQQNLVR